MDRPRITIVSPAAAADNNGNWHTASRWARFLRDRCAVELAGGWPGAGAAAPDLLIALHARRSAAALAAFAARYPERPRVLVLTGTDLYRDIDSSPDAQAALEQAHALVLLQEAALARLPARLRTKARVIYQSAPTLPALAPASGEDVFCMIGHLRPEKDPVTFMRAAGLVTMPRVRLLHIGGALEPSLESAARATAAAHPHYRWLGALAHEDTREQLRRSRALVIASTMEGGANVIIEAVTSGVPVIASDVDGNRGMLGDGYAGYFPVGNAPALARLIERCAGDAAFHAALRAECAARGPLFAPAREQAALRDLVDNLLRDHTPRTTNDWTRP